jgi:hypothetical protein
MKEIEKEEEACICVLNEIKSRTSQLFGFGQADWVYHNAAHFEKSNYKSIDTSHLQWYRFLILSPSIMMTFNSVQTNEPIWFFYYLTHWGVNVSAFSVIATMIAARKHSW